MTERPSQTGAEKLAAQVPRAGGRSLPPVHLWNPPYQGKIDIRIARDGTWFHEGGEIRRPGLVRLFASILRRDGEEYVLVTPVERVGITVDDAPFVAQDVEITGTGRDLALTFHTNVGDIAPAGPDHPIRVEIDADTGEPSPYVLVRANLEALIDRKTFYRIVEKGTEHEGWFGIWSRGRFFPLTPSEAIEPGG